MKQLKYFSLLVILFFFSSLHAQVDVKKEAGYDFTIQKKIECTPVKSQGKTGTCWSFSTVSFLESELIRTGKGQYDLSEMSIVRNIYKDKAMNYVLRQGKAQFSQGSLNHDVIKAFKRGGILPEEVYSGKLEGETAHNHSELAKGLEGYLDGILKSKSLSTKWMTGFEGILDAYLGKAPDQFEYGGKKYTNESFKEELGLNPDDYVEITSYTHHPFYETFVLEIPDNYSNGSYYNVPLSDLQSIVDNALENGYSVAWDGDVSEKGFLAKEGLAIVPLDEGSEDSYASPSKEKNITQEDRQSTFLSYSTTDDHLMHLTGTATDQNGTKYYLTKNSWGEISDYKGFLYMSESYFRLKTVGVLVHKDALSDDMKKKLMLLD